MQTSELEKKLNQLLGDEECINFRPSPNFKHMKKYLKSKFEEANSSPNHSSDPSTTPNSEEQETVKPQATSSSMAQRVQPPLPPNSPPPDFLVVPKQEVEDDEYNDKTSTQTQNKTEKEVVADKQPEKIMCRQFARGMCTRGATCIYAHELILSQLQGVYTFCKNFQNTVCNFPKCKFVHATVFEKEHYYRTGLLPPHTLAHLKDSNSALGPPTASEATPAEGTPVFSNLPPPLQPGISALPTSGSTPPEARPNTEIFGGGSQHVPKRSSPSKREWCEMEQALVPYENDANEPMQKKCKTCDIYERRIKSCKAKLDKCTETSELLAKHKLQLKKSTARLDEAINFLLKCKLNQMSGSPSFVNSAPASGLNDKDNHFPLNARSRGMEANQKIALFLQIMNVIGKENNVQHRVDSPNTR